LGKVPASDDEGAMKGIKNIRGWNGPTSVMQLISLYCLWTDDGMNKQMGKGQK
jgi:hypothetical protein